MEEIANILAAHPKSGNLLQGTGGFRKLRYAGISGRGKSGGVRVIHFFVTRDQEVHIVDIFGKGEKDNLTKAERNELSKLATILKGS